MTEQEKKALRAEAAWWRQAAIASSEALEAAQDAAAEYHEAWQDAEERLAGAFKTARECVGLATRGGRKR